MKTELLASWVARLRAPTPPFFRRLRSLGLGLLAVGMALETAPITWPASWQAWPDYLSLAGVLIAAISQLATPAES